LSESVRFPKAILHDENADTHFIKTKMKLNSQKLISTAVLTSIIVGAVAADDDHHQLRGGENERRAQVLGGGCVDSTSFPAIPFSASAYDACTAFHERSDETFGVCGDSRLPLDGQPNDDPVCLARGAECHVGFTETGEWLEYSFDIQNEFPRAVYNIVARVASKKPRRIRIEIDNRGDTIRRTFTTSGNGFFEFEDIIWGNVRIPVRGPERVFVEFLDGFTNFCSLRIEETSLALNKLLTIPFDANAQDYIAYADLSPQRFGTCGPGPADSQPTRDPICIERGSYCNIGWTQAGEEAIYWVYNSADETVQKDVTLRLASLRSGRRVSVEVEGMGDVEVFEAPGKGYQEFEDFIWSGASFPPGESRLIVKFLDNRVNICSVSVK
jgi:hypothetical protein